MGRLLFWYPFRWFVQLSPEPLVRWLGEILGSADYALSGRKRIERMARNIGRAFGGEANLKAILIENLRNHARNNLEFLRYPRCTSANVEKLVEFRGIEILDRELAKGKGVILATAHFGAKQALQVALGHKGYRLSQIHFHLSAEELTFVQKNVSQRLRKEIEESIPVTFMPADGFMRDAYRCLQSGEALLVAGDGIGLRSRMNDSYLPFDFLGQKMLFPTGMVALAQRAGASIVPVFAVRNGTRHIAAFEPALDTGGDENAVMREYVGILEKYVRQYPSLWEFWEEFDEDNLLAGEDKSV